jgi:hypothetical protein
MDRARKEKRERETLVTSGETVREALREGELKLGHNLYPALGASLSHCVGRQYLVM